jgi:hypothetical protein
MCYQVCHGTAKQRSKLVLIKALNLQLKRENTSRVKE